MPLTHPAMPATDAARSRGRLIDEPACPMRTPFQRDRDRIVHATAFRRLTYKTQVFVFHEGDHYRTRLTHTLEVAQIARAIARQLRLDEDLAEALALAHDLGHPPFGHAGERALDAVLRDFGGFDHNAQSLKVVTRLEKKYLNFDGLNLSLETLDGLAKHNGPIGDGPLREAIRSLGLEPHMQLVTQASLEAQAAAIADDIAYNNHDIDDGLRAGLLMLEGLVDVPLVGRFVTAALATGTPDRNRVIYEVNRRMITAMIEDVVHTARAGIAAGFDPQWRPIVTFSPSMADELQGLKRTLFQRVYRHPRVTKIMDGAEQIVRDLVQHYLANADHLPNPHSERVRGFELATRASLISDFVAGMTDRYALAEHRRLFDATPELR